MWYYGYYWQCAMFDTEGSPVFPFPVQKSYSKMAAGGSRKFGKIHWSILSLFQGNMLYLIIVEEYLGCQCRWGFGTVSQRLMGSFCMKFCPNLINTCSCGTMRY